MLQRVWEFNFFVRLSNILYCIYMPHFVYSFTYWWTLGLPTSFGYFGYRGESCYEQGCVNISSGFQSVGTPFSSLLPFFPSLSFSLPFFSLQFTCWWNWVTCPVALPTIWDLVDDLINSWAGEGVLHFVIYTVLILYQAQFSALKNVCAELTLCRKYCSLNLRFKEREAGEVEIKRLTLDHPVSMCRAGFCARPSSWIVLYTAIQAEGLITQKEIMI